MDCASQAMCDLHNDCLSTLQSAISRGFNIEAVRSFSAICTENGFLTENEADVFISTIPRYQYQENVKLKYKPRSQISCFVMKMVKWVISSQVALYFN